METPLFVEGLLDLAIFLLQLGFQQMDSIVELSDLLGTLVVLMLQTGQLILQFFFVLLQVTNSLLVLEADSPLAVNLSLKLIDSLLKGDLIIE